MTSESATVGRYRVQVLKFDALEFYHFDVKKIILFTKNNIIKGKGREVHEQKDLMVDACAASKLLKELDKEENKEKEKDKEHEEDEIFFGGAGGTVKTSASNKKHKKPKISSKAIQRRIDN